MLEFIKSIYFYKIIFSFINEESKLKIVKHNKNLQHKIDINIINYELFSKRYIEYESNGRAKEYIIYENYNDREPIFDGEYLNGKRNGKGKEYNVNNVSLFEGEYLNDKKWNGKAYKGNNIINEIKKGTRFMK